MKDRSFQVFQRKVSSSGETLSNVVWGVTGKRFKVLRNRTQSKSGGYLTARVNDVNEYPFPLFEGSEFVVSFNRLFLNAADLVGSDDLNDIVLMAFANDNNQHEENNVRVNRYDSFAASTNQVIFGNVESLYIETFGDVRLMGYDGSDETFLNCLPGSHLFVSPSYILGSGTTASGKIIYAK